MGKSKAMGKTAHESTQMFVRKVMAQIFGESWDVRMTKLFHGDRETLDLCAEYLSKNLDYYPLTHMLCLVTNQRFDMNEKDHTRAADNWLCWFEENKDKLAWDEEMEIWRGKRPKKISK